jgi:LmbE family N-acetylglucosaminyl deacetylase
VIRSLTTAGDWPRSTRVDRVSVPEANPRPDGEIERVLMVVAHPDDIEFGGAGTVATWTKAGIDVHYCIVTDGQAGGFEADRDRAEIPAVRRAEQTTAADHVGVHDLHFLGYVDGQHASQHRDPETLATDMRRWSQQNAHDAGLPQNHHAEAFTVIRLD